MSGALDPQLAAAHLPKGARPSVALLWRLDARLGEIVRVARDPVIGLIRLTWWHDAIAALAERPPPAEPLLGALAAAFAAGPVGFAELASLTEGWDALLESPSLDDAALETFARKRGGKLFALIARLVGGAPSDGIGLAGEGWALVDFAVHSGDPAGARRAVALALPRLRMANWSRATRALRLLANLAALDARALTQGRTPPGPLRRIVSSLRLGLTGR